jgi:hypothetical protein
MGTFSVIFLPALRLFLPCFGEIFDFKSPSDTSLKKELRRLNVAISMAVNTSADSMTWEIKANSLS